jgi:CheY-like chemotaxis protein
MKRLKDMASSQMKNICIIALTANAISGARQMFMKEGFDGFISKPININDFERTMNKVLPSITKGGNRS